MSKDTETVVDNRKVFRKIVRDYNEKYGFNFALPKDQDYTEKYAHPVHEQDGIRITSQISPDHEDIYGIRVVLDGVSIDLGYKREYTYSEIKETISSEQFKTRLQSLRQLRDLSNELGDHINEVTYSLFQNAADELEKENAYDLAVRTARTLYRGSK